MEQKDVVIKMLREQFEIELNDIAQDSLKEASRNGDSTGTILGMNLFKYKELAIGEYTKMQQELGLTSSEIKSIVEESVSKVLRKYIQL